MQKGIFRAFTFALLSATSFFSQHAVADTCSFSCNLFIFGVQNISNDETLEN